MKKILILGLALALTGGVAYANFCARDAVPAATLLFPYVAVQTDAAGVPVDLGQTTITGITNVSSTAQIVHFTVWDINSVPRIDFDEILSGYDVLQINWRDFLNGRFDMFDTAATAFTATAPLTRDPFEWGPDGRAQAAGLTTPQNRDVITTCTTVPPYGNRSDLATTIRSLITGALAAYDHDGCSDPSALRTDLSWYGSDLTANPVVFYVTADVVSACSLDFPSQTDYWANYAMNNNVLTGDIIYLNSATNYSESFPAVHIEASTQQGGSVFGFYEEKVAAETYREPVATAFAFRYGNDPLAGISSNLIFWKNFAETYGPGKNIEDCGAYLYYAWDMDERSWSRTTQPISGLPTGGRDPNQLPFETQKVPLTNAYFDLPASYGWMLLGAAAVVRPHLGRPQRRRRQRELPGLHGLGRRAVHLRHLLRRDRSDDHGQRALLQPGASGSRHQRRSAACFGALPVAPRRNQWRAGVTPRPLFFGAARYGGQPGTKQRRWRLPAVGTEGDDEPGRRLPRPAAGAGDAAHVCGRWRRPSG